MKSIPTAPLGSATSSQPDTSLQATLTNDQSSKSARKRFEAIVNAISLQALADGATRSGSPDGLTIGLCGLEAAPVSHSLKLGNAEVSLTNGTYGQISTASSASVALQSLLESRLRASMALNGSPEYVLTWREQVMPVGLPICVLRPSARHTKGRGIIGWPTPTARDGKRGTQLPRKWDKGIPLSQAVIEVFLTASRRMKVTTGAYGALTPQFSLSLQGYPPEWAHCAPPAIRSSRKSRRNSSEPQCHDDYDAQKDFSGSLNEGYAAIRARMAAGGPGWERGGK